MSAHRSVNGIAWKFPDPEAEWVAWQNRIAAFERESQSILASLDRSIGNASPNQDLLKLRLERHKKARLVFAQTLSSLLGEFKPFDSKLFDVTLALRTRLAPTQGLLTYSSNLLRDWAPFGAEENALNLDLLRSLVGSHEGDRAIVVGAGGGRLAYDFHQNLTQGSTLAFDHNPLLLSFAKHMALGHTLDWVDFPQNPVDMNASACIETCRAPEVPRSGLQFELGDILTPHFDESSFDMVITPWVIDILPESFDHLSIRINSLLVSDGVWVNQGPLAFSQADPATRITKEELLEHLDHAGFDVELTRDLEMPYLKSPHHRGHRIESVFGFRARKKNHLKAPPPRPAQADYLLDSSIAVPMSRELAELGSKSMIFGTVCSWVNGTRSLDDLAFLLNQHYGVPTGDALLALRKFFADQKH